MTILTDCNYIGRMVLGNGFRGPEKEIHPNAPHQWIASKHHAAEAFIHSERVPVCKYVVEIRNIADDIWERFVVDYEVRHVFVFRAEPDRCIKCGWPLFADAKDGCTVVSCSQRGK